MNGHFYHPVGKCLVGLFKGSGHRHAIRTSHARKLHDHHVLVKVSGTYAQRLGGLVVVFSHELNRTVSSHRISRTVEVFARSHVLYLRGRGHVTALVQHGERCGFARFQTGLVHLETQLRSGSGSNRHLDGIGSQIPVLGRKFEFTYIIRRNEFVFALTVFFIERYVGNGRGRSHIRTLICYGKRSFTQSVADNGFGIDSQGQGRNCNSHFVGSNGLLRIGVDIGCGKFVFTGRSAREGKTF